LRAQVQEREARFTRFAEATDYGFGMGELTGRLTYANSGLLRMLDEQGPKDAYAKTFFDYYTEEDRKALESEILPIVLEKGQWVGEIPLLSSKGRLTHTEQNIFLIYDERGEPHMVANIITDIAEEGSLDDQVRMWNEGLSTGSINLYVPLEKPADLSDIELSDADLEAVAGGAGDCCCSCSSPCCSCS